MTRKPMIVKFSMRVITVIMMLCILSFGASAAVTMETEITATDVTMTLHFGAGYTAKNVVVQVFEPAGSLDDLKGDSDGYDVTDTETISQAICCIYHGKTDANGDLTFNFAPTGDKGKYLVRVGGQGMSTPEEMYFEFISDGDADMIIAELVNNLSVEAVADIFEKPENDNVYKPYQILNLDESDFYKLYDIPDAELKNAVHSYICHGVAQNMSIDVSGFAQLFEDAVFVSTVSAPGVLDEFILGHEAELISAGADMIAYKASAKPLDICTSLILAQPYASIDDFVSKLNDTIPKKQISDTPKPTPPSGNAGGVKVSGGSSGGGSQVSIPVSKPVNTTEQAAFADIADVAWAKDAITAMKAKGIIAGRGDGSFAPYDKVTREEFVKMLSVMLELSAEGKTAPDFSDIIGEEWFAPYVYAAAANEIVTGNGDGFGVGQEITRQDMAVLCMRAAKYKGASLKAVRSDMPFTDVISDYAVDAVSELWSAGIVNGVSETEFAPLASATRAEAAKLLYEVLKAIQ